MSECFIEPLDVLYLRGNPLFGDSGSHGAALMPPWPSVFAGALRSHLLSISGADLNAFASGQPHPVVGSPEAPKVFITAVQLARKTPGNIVERFFALPADIVVLRDNATDALSVYPLTPVELPLPGSRTLSMVPVLQAPAVKPANGYLLRESAWREYLAGRTPNAEGLISTDELWSGDLRLGIALDPRTRAAAEGALYTAEAVAMRKDKRGAAGFVVSLSGVDGQSLQGVIRLGGDGRGAALRQVPVSAAPDPLDGKEELSRFKLVLTTPGIFEGGWRLPGLQENHVWRGPDGCSARLLCAAVPRAETVSGWDLARKQPKRARRAAPVGSVYWFTDFQGTPASLRKLVQNGLWGLPGQSDDPQRQAEGFNRCAIGLWS